MIKNNNDRMNWKQDYITSIEPILMKDPLLELLGQANGPIPYFYEEAVKLAGHSCGAVSGAWNITRLALKSLYAEEIPVRGQIKVLAPGAEGEGTVGVLGEVITFITGSAPKTGFQGGGFGKNYIRRDLMIYAEKNTNTAPSEMVWVFERLDNNKRVGIKYNTSKILPQVTAEWNKLSSKIVNGVATHEETDAWVKYWNDRVIFVFENADSLDGLFTIEQLS